MTSRIKAPLDKLFITPGHFEATAWATNEFICGIDEVGRGCLAGPLMTAAVILPQNTSFELLQDSKMLCEADRLKAYSWIKSNAWYATGIVHHRMIDDHNIWQATLIGMKKALMHLLATAPHRPSAIVIDAMPLKLGDTGYANIPVHSFCKGESLSASIAAASIVAKVKRDALMKRLNILFPGYYFADHKGYATEKHTIALWSKPKSIIHRSTFATPITLPYKKRGPRYEEECSGK
jgi:ribonuclease HII